MKRGIILLVLLVLLISPIILAAGDGEVVLPTDISQEDVKEQLTTLTGGLDEKTENVLEREIQIPKEFVFLYIVITGIGQGVEAVSWGELIVFCLVVLIIFIISLEILEFTAFETNWVKYVIAGGIAILLAITGTIYKLTNLFHALVGNLAHIVGGVLVVLIFVFVLKPILDNIKNRKKVLKAKELGIKSGAALKGLSKITEKVVHASKE